MSASANPDIVTDGLVFMYDTDDGKSYKGEPTTNVVANPLPTNGWSVSQAQGSTLTRTYLTEDGIPFMRFSDVTNGSDYPRITNSVFANSATITGTFSTSLEVKGTAGAVLRLRIYENGSTKITNSITLTSEWTRYTFDNQSTGFNLNQPYFNPATSDAIYDIRNIQVEAKSHSTPFVNGTRSATQGLIDRTGTSTIDISNASFDSNAQMTFDGTDDYIEVLNTNLPAPSTNLTMECVFQRVSGRTIINYGPSGFNTAKYYGFECLGSNPALRSNINTSSGLTQIIGTTVINPNTKYYGAMTYDGSSVKLYVNGELEASASKSGSILNSSTPSLNIGRKNSGNGEYINGEIPIVKLYNKALTAAEVLQNYNATKSRFNL
jgi:hypothetical protein